MEGTTSRNLSTVINKSTQYSQVYYCAVPKLTASMMMGDVTVVDPSTENDVSCTLYSRNTNGETVGFSSRSTSGFNSAPQRLFFSTMNGATPGHAVIQCSLPPIGATGYSALITDFGIWENN